VGRNVTILDVAQHSGVSRATVSLVLRDHPRISAATKQRVRASIEELDYRYHRGAASLRSTRTMTVGLVVADVRNSYFAEFSMAVQAALQAAGYSVLVGYTRDDVNEQRATLTSMTEHSVDGLVLLPAPGTSSTQLRKILRTPGTPHVLIGRHVEGYESDFVTTDNLNGSITVAQHLHEIGATGVALLGGSERTSVFADRVKGLALGLGVDEVRRVPSSSSLEGGVAAVTALLEARRPGEAIVAYTDTVALGIYEELRRRRITPGKDVPIAAFDDSPISRLLQPALTTLATFPHTLGSEAAGLLLSRMRDPVGPPRTVTIAPRLEVRSSTSDWAARRR